MISLNSAGLLFSNAKNAVAQKQLDHFAYNTSMTSQQALDTDTVSLRFSGLEPSKASNTKAAINNIFAPKSIAVIGASTQEGSVGYQVLNNLVTGGYTGEVYPVNPKYNGENPDWTGDKSHAFVKDVSALPNNKVDSAVVMVPKKIVASVIDELGKKGVKSVVVISGGFNKEEKADLNKLLEQHGMKMIGPNVVGVANGDPAVKMNATFVQGQVTPGQGAVMSQSGAVGIDLINKSRLAGLGLSQMASIGDQADIDSSELLKHWKDDPSVKYVMGYLESIDDPEAFRKAALEITKQKPVFVIKSGKSDTAKKAAASHTGSLAGNDTAVEALFTQTGVQRVDSIDELFSIAKAFELAPPLKGDNIAIVSNSGGYGVMLTDILETQNTGLKVAQLSEATTKTVKSLMPEQASISNPIDTIATTPADTPDKFKQSLETIVQDPNVDSLVVSLVPLMNIKSVDMARIIADVQATTDKPILGVLSTSEQDLLDVQTQLKAEGKKVPPLYASNEEAATALTAMEKHRVWSSEPVDQPVEFNDIKPEVVKKILDTAKAEGRKLLTTTESLYMLEAYGIRTAPHTLVNKPSKEAMTKEILAQAKNIGYPIAIKFVSKTITHKTDIGGVAFDIKTPEALEAAVSKMLGSLAKAGVNSFAEGEGIMVQQSIPNGRETLIGFKDDETFGKLMAFGLGGIYVNIFKDVNFRLAPLTQKDAEAMVNTIKGHKILSGYRGKPSVDFETLTDTILRYSKLATDFPELAESDINPFFAQPKDDPSGRGGYAVDGRFSLK